MNTAQSKAQQNITPSPSRQPLKSGTRLRIICTIVFFIIGILYLSISALFSSCNNSSYYSSFDYCDSGGLGLLFLIVAILPVMAIASIILGIIFGTIIDLFKNKKSVNSKLNNQPAIIKILLIILGITLIPFIIAGALTLTSFIFSLNLR